MGSYYTLYYSKVVERLLPIECKPVLKGLPKEKYASFKDCHDLNSLWIYEIQLRSKNDF